MSRYREEGREIDCSYAPTPKSQLSASPSMFKPPAIEIEDRTKCKK